MDVEDNQQEQKEPSLNIGEALSQARTNHGLTDEEIAKELNLGLDIIRNLEQNEFDQNLPSAFIRGYIKSFATKVGIDTSSILSEFDKQIGAEQPYLKRRETISKFEIRRKDVNSSNFFIKLASAIIVLSFVGFAGWELWKNYMPGNEVAQSEGGNEIPLALNDDEIDLSVEKLQEIEEQGVVDQQASSHTLSQSQTNIEEDKSSKELTLSSQQDGSHNLSSVGQEKVKDTEQNISDTMTQLVLDFSAECWVRIVDARGEVIALGVKQAGKHMPIEGVTPITLILGDPSAVTMSFDGLPYDLSSYRAGRRAEIILN